MAAEIIERNNGLIKTKCNTLIRKFQNLQALLNEATFLLNNRPRANRLSPVEELINPHLEKVEYTTDLTKYNYKNLPYKIIVKAARDDSLS